MFTRIKIENLACFSNFSWNGQEKLNVIIGENDTGKTLLMKMLYTIAKSLVELHIKAGTERRSWKEILARKLYWVFQPSGDRRLGELVRKGQNKLTIEADVFGSTYNFGFGRDTTSKILECTEVSSGLSHHDVIFLPPKEILTAFDAIAAVREKLELFGFDDTYYDLIQALRLPPPRGRVPRDSGSLLRLLDELVDGEIKLSRGEFILNRRGSRYGMWQTAEGVKKIGILATLIRNRNLGRGSILFIDEPESNLHPSAIMKLMEMLSDLTRAGVQVFMATHNYFVLKQAVIIARRTKTSIPCCSLRKSKDGTEADFYDMKDGMPENPIVEASIELYRKDVESELES